jgi:sugar phosphate isomerase/epimerase
MNNKPDKMPGSVSRRNFISTVAAAGIALPLTGLKGTNFFAGSFESARKIHVFSKALSWLGYDQMAALIAETGAEGIDLTVRPEGNVLPEKAESDLPLAVEAARKHGLSVDMIVTNIVMADQPYAESVIRTASSLGIKFYRLGWLDYDNALGIQGSIKKYRSDLKKLEELNRRYNIHGAYQNHAGTMVGGAVWDIYELLYDMDPQFLGCQYDVRHATVEGSTSWPNGLKLVAPWVKCSDIKDFKWENVEGKWTAVSVPLGEGIVDFVQYFTLIKKLNIPGPISVHFEYPPVENSKEKLSESEKRKLFPAVMKKDIERLKSWLTKYQI